MKKATIISVFVLLLVAAGLSLAPEKTAPSRIITNKDKLLVTAVQGKIAQPQPSRVFGHLGRQAQDGHRHRRINYNLKIGDRVFGWAGGTGRPWVWPRIDGR